MFQSVHDKPVVLESSTSTSHGSASINQGQVDGQEGNGTTTPQNAAGQSFCENVHKIRELLPHCFREWHYK